MSQPPGTAQSRSPGEDCPKCQGRSDRRPCEEWVDILRAQFSDQIDLLFRQKMQEFVDFIEEYVNVDDQIDVN